MGQGSHSASRANAGAPAHSLDAGTAVNVSERRHYTICADVELLPIQIAESGRPESPLNILRRLRGLSTVILIEVRTQSAPTPPPHHHHHSIYFCFRCLQVRHRHSRIGIWQFILKIKYLL